MSTTITDEQITMAMIAKAGTHMQTAAEIESVSQEIRIDRIANAILKDFSGPDYAKTLAGELSYKRVKRGLHHLDAGDLASVVERMANGTPEEAAWTFGFYALV